MSILVLSIVTLLLSCAQAQTIANTVAIDRSGKLGYASNAEGLFSTKDSGKTWEKLSICAYAASLDISNDGKTIMAVYDPPSLSCGAISTSNDYGVTWTKPSISTKFSTIMDGDVSGDGKYLVAVAWATGNGHDDIYTSSDYGATFNPVKGTDAINLYSSVMSQSGDRILVGQSLGIILQSTDKGNSFSMLPTSPSQGSYVSMTCNEDCHYILATTTSSVILSSDFGVSWNTTSLAKISGSAYHLALSGSGQVQYAGGTNTRLSKSTDYGQSWSVLDASKNTVWSSIDCDSTGLIVIASSSEKGVFISSDGGATWTASNL